MSTCDITSNHNTYTNLFLLPRNPPVSPSQSRDPLSTASHHTNSVGTRPRMLPLRRSLVGTCTRTHVPLSSSLGLGLMPSNTHSIAHGHHGPATFLHRSLHIPRILSLRYVPSALALISFTVNISRRHSLHVYSDTFSIDTRRSRPVIPRKKVARVRTRLISTLR